jgi:hypothetical protein
MKKEMKRAVWIGLVMIIVAVATFFIFNHPSPPNIPISSVDKLIYSNSKYGFSFSYPSVYAITERIDPPEYTVILSRKDDPPAPVASEGYPTITIQIIPNSTRITLLEWLAENPNFSNYSLPSVSPYPLPGTVASDTTVGKTTTPALLYYWNGEVGGENVAFALRGNVIIFSGTYNDQSDPIKKDFDTLVRSINIL